MMIEEIKARFSRARIDGGFLRNSGNYSPAYLYAILTLLGLKIPVRISIHSFYFSIRPLTPDLAVVRDNLSGELQPAIDAVRPLHHKMIIDAGGYIGTAAIAFASAFPEAIIVTLEPLKENFKLLRQNTRSFPNIRPVNKALGSVEGVRTLVDRGTGEWGYSLIPNPTGYKVEVVNVTTIPAILSEYGASGIDLLKLDIEGSELELFKSACQDWVRQTTVILAELHDRIAPGCEAAFHIATEGRQATRRSGEKFLSIA